MFFVDYGDTHSVTMTCIRQLKILYRCVPPFSVRCAFRDPIQTTGQDKEKSLAFTDCTDGQVCNAVFGEQMAGLQVVESLFVGEVNVGNFLLGKNKASEGQSIGENGPSDGYCVQVQGIPNSPIPWRLIPICLTK